MTDRNSHAADAPGELEDQLDAELRRLFDDERIGLRPRHDAAETVVAGARRLRRRRTVAAGGGGTLAVLALVGGSLLLGGQRPPAETPDARIAAPPASTGASLASTSAEVTSQPEQMSPPGSAPEKTSSQRAEPRTSSSRESTEQAASSALPEASALLAAPTLGPQGYHQLTLGMSYRDAEATGMLAGPVKAPPEDACSTYQLAEGTVAVHDVTISGTAGVVMFRAAEAVTPEGIGAGSSLERLRATYSDLTAESTGYSATAGPAARYFFTASDDSVTEVQLRAADWPC